MIKLNEISRVVVLILLIGLGGCSAEDGVDGSQGSQGIQGEEGPQGEQGEQGADGEDGNADIMYSDWIPANFTGSSASVKFMGIEFPADLPSAFNIKNTHVILVYFTGFGDGNIYLLPVLNFRQAQFTYGYGSGALASSDINIRAEALSGNLTEFQIDPARGNKLRYVIIPPTINISGKSSLNYSDYEAVKSFYKIPD